MPSSAARTERIIRSRGEVVALVLVVVLVDQYAAASVLLLDLPHWEDPEKKPISIFANSGSLLTMTA
jgi:hypothetical protein